MHDDGGLWQKKRGRKGEQGNRKVRGKGQSDMKKK